MGFSLCNNYFYLKNSRYYFVHIFHHSACSETAGLDAKTRGIQIEIALYGDRSPATGSYSSL